MSWQSKDQDAEIYSFTVAYTGWKMAVAGDEAEIGLAVAQIP